MPAFNFRLEGRAIMPQDNGYQILAALSRRLPHLHGNRLVQVAPVRGTRQRDHRIRLDRSSILHIRVPDASLLDGLEGSWLALNGEVVGVGERHEVEIKPSTYLASRLVVFDGVFGREAFEDRLTKYLGEGTVKVGRSRAIKVKGISFKGFSVHLNGLSPETSLRIQREGLGKFTSMGCGVFYPGR